MKQTATTFATTNAKNNEQTKAENSEKGKNTMIENKDFAFIILP